MNSIILNSEIKLHLIREKLYWLKQKEKFLNMTIEPVLEKNYSFRKTVNSKLVFGDFRESVKIIDGKNQYFMYFGANSFGANPNVVSIGKKEAKRLILVKEVFTDVYSDRPNLIEQSFMDIPFVSAYSSANIYNLNLMPENIIEEQKKLILIFKSRDVYSSYFQQKR